MALDTTLFDPALTFWGWSCPAPGELFSRLADELEARGLVAPTWRDAVAAREEVYPTGLATASCGIALPHADAEHIVRPFIALVRPAAPVPFQPMGGIGDVVDAELVMALGFTHAEDQIGALQHVMEVFADEHTGDALRAATSPAELIALLRG
ncbi:MAG TPA: PTS sugar transporter subunit IIA [Candidatus Coprousia avicola]|nr:PTS sugar transporter subunit IIA [Candidatus Coprousia avicola]